MTASNPVQFRTIADVLSALGNVDPGRVLLDPPPGRATDSDVVRRNENPLRSANYDLVDGTLVERAAGFWEGMIATAFAQHLGNALDRRGRGGVAALCGMLKLSNVTTRSPMLSYVADRPGLFDLVRSTPNPPLVPELVVDVVKQGNTVGELRRMRTDYFAVGTTRVWQVDPRERTIAAHTSPTDYTLLGEHAPVELLPGRPITLAEILRSAEPRDQHP